VLTTMNNVGTIVFLILPEIPGLGMSLVCGAR
jgi:hypothetical protein